MTPNRLVFNTVTALHDIYLNPKVTKGQAYRNSQLRAKYPSLVNAIDSNQHRRKRRIISPVLAERSMRRFEPVMSSLIDVFLQQILPCSQARSTVNMAQRCSRLGVDIIGQLSFGYFFKTQTEETNRHVPEVIDATAKRISVYMQLPSITPYYFENLFLLLKMKTLIKFDKTIRTLIKTRMGEDKNAHHDLYSVVTEHIGKEHDAFLPGEMWPEAIFFIMAGGVTTATTMSAAFFYLSRNPSAYDTLAEEIRSSFSSAQDICMGPRLAGCKYLRAVIDESLRMSPPTVGTLWRQQEHGDEPIIVDGHVIPPGVQVGVSMYALLHKEEYFSDPWTFSPERWLDPPEGTEETEGDKARRATMRKVFAPFIMGDRGCLGKSMAYMEASLTLARTMWFFDFERAPGREGELGGGGKQGRMGEYQLRDLFVSSNDGPNLVFKTRGDHWKALVD
ncbi:Isotrichodermin C-15 hydroxylase [Escovopsis weberi]|uniref:Isotrichodermin C-15 hydroxylase n=1 Tax=Escovopsis weberi TaxID=150374 RepID=A0A0M8N8L1_ESCWE|nr:Isotrichodermin C-15 hydroxylase [Escovopsis weberi]